MFPTWVWFLFLVGAFVLFLSGRHYWNSRVNDNHDSYLVFKETCKDGRSKFKKCPNLEMWGFKWSVIITLLVINTILVAALYTSKRKG